MFLPPDIGFRLGIRFGIGFAQPPGNLQEVQLPSKAILELFFLIATIGISLVWICWNFFPKQLRQVHPLRRGRAACWWYWEMIFFLWDKASQKNPNWSTSGMCFIQKKQQKSPNIWGKVLDVHSYGSISSFRRCVRMATSMSLRVRQSGCCAVGFRGGCLPKQSFWHWGI